MSRFAGKETYSIDSKGRINIAKMCKNLSPEANETFMFMEGLEGCVYAYPLDVWRIKEEKFDSLNEYNDDDRFFLRSLLESCQEVKLDAQQRVTLPKELISYANIEKRVLVTGVLNRLEFWNPEIREQHMKSGKSKEVTTRVMVTKKD